MIGAISAYELTVRAQFCYGHRQGLFHLLPVRVPSSSEFIVFYRDNVLFSFKSQTRSGDAKTTNIKLVTHSIAPVSADMSLTQNSFPHCRTTTAIVVEHSNVELLRINSRCQYKLVLLNSPQFYGHHFLASYPILSATDDASVAMNFSRSNLFPILPSTVRDSRYLSIVR